MNAWCSLKGHIYLNYLATFTYRFVPVCMTFWWTSSAKGLKVQLFHDGVPYHIETSSLIFRANQWTGFYMIGNSVMKQSMVPYPRKTRQISSRII